ncbi:TPA: hypothetical protein DCL30_01510 [Candidatus Peribacteria bacterium]|nr:MAG: hypothetical protein A3J91_03010 [Candidatus Peribacteria bacterium RIFOXYC2_FULL_58_10]OGJ85347.1 MAG: hypothetical protein A2529_02710 [Candidatus Peribacteria bacterium RIFOXYD2_FULL_58_15]HAI98204.1 hypothetical protein [Candidatus Peribacteria bacterium]HAS34515.1 hypothetical protein [Candidatus Peribacteria bacterium]
MLILGVCALVLAILLQMPQALRWASPLYLGVSVRLSTDEEAYLARVEEGLTGRPELAAEAIIGDENLAGTQAALIEETIGRLFSWTEWRAATVLQVIDSVVPPLLLLTLWIFFVLSGLTRIQALIGAGLFCVLHLSGLNRPIHQGASTLLTVTALIGILLGLEYRRWLGVLGGILLGILTGVYFWSWTYAWAWIGVLMIWLLTEQFFLKEDRAAALKRLVTFIFIGVVTAAPFLWMQWRLAGTPLYALAFFRSGVRFGHAPESLIYSSLFLLMMAGVLGAVLTQPELRRRYRLIAVTAVAGFLLINQQMVHGVIFNFVSHYIFLLCAGAFMALLMSVRLPSKWLVLSLLGSVVYLSAIVSDNVRPFVSLFSVTPSNFAEQHFATALPVLDALPRTTILSDPATEMFIAGASRHDVVFSTYLKNALLSHDELAWRLCMTLEPLPPPERGIDQRQHLIYPDAVVAFKDPVVRSREVELVTAACAQVDSDPERWLRRFHVEYVLWDERRQTQWDLNRLGVPRQIVAKGDGWSLWKFQ